MCCNPLLIILFVPEMIKFLAKRCSWHLCPFDKTQVWQPPYFLTQDAPESRSLWPIL